MQKLSDEVIKILNNCSIFENIPEERYPNIFECLRAKQECFEKGITITGTDNNKLAGIVISGTVEMLFYDELGHTINVKHYNAGELFGTELACSSQHTSPTTLCAITDCEVIFLSIEKLLDARALPCVYRSTVTINLLRDFARQSMFLNMKIRIMAQKRLRDKIKIFMQNSHITSDGIIKIPFNRRGLAEFLNVNRTALSRELSRMRDENIIEFDNNIIKLIDFEFLSI